MQAGTYFPKVRRVLLCFPPSNTLLASFHAASRAHRSCHSVSSCERSSNFGALELRSWGSPGQIIPSDRFWSRMVAWRTTACVNFTHRISFRMSELFRKIDEDFGGVMSWKTQPNCRESEDWRLDEFCPKFLSPLFPSFPGRSWQASVTDSLSCRFPFFNIATALLSLFFLDLLPVCSSTWRCASEHISPILQPLLVL